MIRRSVKRGRLTVLALTLALLVCLLLAAYLWRYQSLEVSLEGLPAGCIEAIHLMRGVSSGAGNCAVRAWYLDQIARIDTIDAALELDEVALEQRARCAYSLRHEARIEARSRMPSHAALVLLRLRDVIVYGDPDGPTFFALVDKTDRDSSYQRLIHSASMTNESVDEQCELSPAGRQ